MFVCRFLLCVVCGCVVSCEGVCKVVSVPINDETVADSFAAQWAAQVICEIDESNRHKPGGRLAVGCEEASIDRT